MRIRDKSAGGVLSVTLHDLLRNLGEHGSTLEWAVMFLRAIASPESGVDMLQLERQINSSPNGYRISWDELCVLSTKLAEILETLIVASPDLSGLTRYKSDREYYDNCCVVLEAIDASYWQIYHTDPNVLKSVAVNFKEVQWAEV